MTAGAERALALGFDLDSQMGHVLTSTDVVTPVLRFILEWVSELDGRVSSLESSAALLTNRVTVLESAHGGVSLEPRMIAVEAGLSTVTTGLGAAVAASSTLSRAEGILDGRVTVLESHSTAGLDPRVDALETTVSAIQDAQAVDEENLATQSGALTEASDQLGALEILNMPDRLMTVEADIKAILDRIEVRSFTIVIPNTERNPITMSTQILDSDTSKVASLSFVDALGFATTDEGTTVVWSSSDETKLTIDASSGAITPVAPTPADGSGPVQVQAAVTTADGTAVSGAPADVDVLAGAAVGFTVNIA